MNSLYGDRHRAELEGWRDGVLADSTLFDTNLTRVGLPRGIRLFITMESLLYELSIVCRECTWKGTNY